MEMNALDEDSLTCIFNYLNFNEKHRIQRTCKKWKQIIHQSFRSQKQILITTQFTLKSYKKDWSSKDYVAFEEFDLVTFKNILIQCPNLVKIQFSFIDINEEILLVLTELCEAIEAFTFNYCRGINFGTIILLTNLYPNISLLNLKNCDLSEDALDYALRKLKKLKHLDISESHLITGECFKNLKSSIESLNLSYCESLSYSGIYALIEGYGKNLTTLILSGIFTDQMMSLICENLTGLKYFSCVYSCTRDSGSQVDLLGCIGTLVNLETLILRETDAYYGSLDDDAVYTILKGCSKLKTLELYLGSGQPLVSDQSLSFIDQFCPNLEVLLIDNAECITNKTLHSISNLKNLKKVSLIDPVNVTNEGLATIIDSCAKLEYFWIGFDVLCKNITNTTLEKCIDVAKKNHKRLLRVEFSETAVEVEPDYQVPRNIIVHISKYKQSSMGLRYTEMTLPQLSN